MSSFWNGPGGQEMLPLTQNIKIFNGNMHTTNTIPSPGTSWDYSVISLIRYFRFIKVICTVSVTVEPIHQIKSEWALLFVGWFFFFFADGAQRLVIILPITGGNPIFLVTMPLIIYLLLSCCSSNSLLIFALSYNCSWILMSPRVFFPWKARNCSK